jgi:hypothetical protein
MNIPKGAVQCHLYNVENVLRPRGRLKKESLSLYIRQKLLDSYESWTDPECGDNPTEAELLNLMKRNLEEEIDSAWKSFSKAIKRNK